MALALEELGDCVSGQESIQREEDRQEIAGAINRFLESLPERERNVFLRRYWFGDSVTDIAAALGRSENSVSVTLNRCRGKLRTYLEQEGYFHE